jgi:hypothetical protein
MPYRLAGKLIEEGGAQVVLAKGDSVITAREGATLEDGYRIEAIGRDEVTLLYVPLGLRQTLPMTSSLVIDRPATATAAATAAAADTSPAQLR